MTRACIGCCGEPRWPPILPFMGAGIFPPLAGFGDSPIRLGFSAFFPRLSGVRLSFFAAQKAPGCTRDSAYFVVPRQHPWVCFLFLCTDDQTFCVEEFVFFPLFLGLAFSTTRPFSPLFLKGGRFPPPLKMAVPFHFFFNRDGPWRESYFLAHLSYKSFKKKPGPETTHNFHPRTNREQS